MAVHEYLSHRLYADAKFRSLIELLSNYLVEHQWVVDGVDGYTRLTEPPKIGIVHGERSTKTFPQASIISAPFRSIAEDSGEFLFRVVHLRWAFEKELITPFQVTVARKQFENCPNYIQIETHRKWAFTQKGIAEKISTFIETAGVKTYIRSYEGELLDLLEGFNDYEQKVDAIHDLTRNSIPWDKTPELTLKHLPVGFVTIMSRLQHNSVHFLRTADHLTYLRKRCSEMRKECASGDLRFRQHPPRHDVHLADNSG